MSPLIGIVKYIIIYSEPSISLLVRHRFHFLPPTFQVLLDMLHIMQHDLIVVVQSEIAYMVSFIEILIYYKLHPHNPVVRA